MPFALAPAIHVSISLSDKLIIIQDKLFGTKGIEYLSISDNVFLFKSFILINCGKCNFISTTIAVTLFATVLDHNNPLTPNLKLTINTIFNTIKSSYNITYDYTDYYSFYTVNHDFYTSDSAVLTQQEQILFPILHQYAYITNQPIPLIKTITITINSSNFHMYIPADTITKIWNGSSTVSIIAGDYTYTQYTNKLLQNFIGEYSFLVL